MLGLFQIDEQGTGRGYSKREVVYCKSLKGIHPELPFQFFDRTVIYERPFFEGGDVVMFSVPFTDAFFISSRHKKFLRSE